MAELIESVAYWVHDLGIWGYPLAIGLMAGVAVLPIPAEIPAAVNGMLFGALTGTAITWVGAMVGAIASFELSRHFGRPLAERILPSAALGRVDGFAQAASWPGMLIARLIPVVAFTALNWGAGLTTLSRRTFIWTTAVGIMPGTLLFVSTGQGLARFYAGHPYHAVLVLLAIVAIIMASRRVQPRLATPPLPANSDPRADS